MTKKKKSPCGSKSAVVGSKCAAEKINLYFYPPKSIMSVEEINMNIKTESLRGYGFPVYLHYSNENPQGAFIAVALDEEEVWADSNAEIGNGVPASVWHGVVRRIPISPFCDGDALADFMESDEARALIQRMLDGATVKRDQSYNWTGQLSDDAREAEDELSRLALEVRQNVVWSAEEYLDGVRHEYIGKYRTLLQAGKVDVRAEAEQIEADNPTDGDGTTLMLRKVEGFVERCIQEAGEE